MTGKIAVKLSPEVILRCEKCKCPVVKKTATGRFLINGTSISVDTAVFTAAGECPRCKARFTCPITHDSA